MKRWADNKYDRKTSREAAEWILLIGTVSYSCFCHVWPTYKTIARINTTACHTWTTFFLSFINQADVNFSYGSGERPAGTVDHPWRGHRHCRLHLPFFFWGGGIPLSGTQVIPLVVFSFCVHVSNPGWDRDPAATAQVQASGVGSPFQRVLLSCLLEDGVYCWGHTDAEWILECGRTPADNTEGFFFLSADRRKKKSNRSKKIL